MKRAGTFFTLDLYEAAAVADALRTRMDVLRKELRNKHNTDLVRLQLSNQLAHAEEISERLARRFAKARRGLEALMKDGANAR